MTKESPTDGAGFAAWIVLQTMLIDRALSDEDNRADVIDLLDRSLFVIEQKEAAHSEPADYADARLQIESLLKVLRPS